MTSTTSAERQAFWGISALLFAASAAGTIGWCASMSRSTSTTAEMHMPGGWTSSMAWMRMPGQTCPGAAASFLGMWVVMMVAMMLPSLLPMLRRYRAAVGSAGRGKHASSPAAGRRPGAAGRSLPMLARRGDTACASAHCSRRCAGMMAILLCIGVMDLRTMVVVAAAITVERFAPAGERFARVTGAVFVGASLFCSPDVRVGADHGVLKTG